MRAAGIFFRLAYNAKCPEQSTSLVQGEAWPGFCRGRIEKSATSLLTRGVACVLARLLRNADGLQPDAGDLDDFLNIGVKL